MLFLKNFRGAGATCVRPVLGHLDAVWQVTLTLRNDDSEAVNATFQGVAKRVLVKQNKSGVESVAVSVNPLQALDPIGNTTPLLQSVVTSECFQTTFSTDQTT
jgi:hypothetical protein